MAQEYYGNYGTVLQNHKQARMIALWWYSVPFDGEANVAGAIRDAAAMRVLGLSGVYAFEGRHDSRPEGGLLYIGRVGVRRDDSDADGFDSDRYLGQRIRESAARFAWEARRPSESPNEQQRSGLYGDVWDVTVRFAAVDASLVADVEALLIKAHAPSFNAQHVRGPLKDDVLDLVVMNGGAKGRILPIVAGAYYDRRLWDRIEGG